MAMARHNAAELWGQSQGLVRASAGPGPSETATDLRGWARKAPMSAGSMIVTGIGLAAVGAVGAWLVPVGFVGMMLFGSAFTLGGGMAFLGGAKLRAKAEQAALPPATHTSPQVLGERARRVHAILDRGGNFTFEHLLAELRWTESALLETLVYMKDSGTMVEDLDLDSGQWVYRTQQGDYGAGTGSLTLEDRQARQQAISEANG